MVITVSLSGMRSGELSAFKWPEYVDGEIHVEGSVWRRDGKATKTDERRRITVGPLLAQVLAEQRPRLLETQHPGLESGLVFLARPSSAKTRITRCGEAEATWHLNASVLDKPLRKICDKAKPPEVSAHGPRRTWENLLRKAGVDQLVRRAVAGWRTERARAIYTTVDREERDAAAVAVVRLLEAKVPEPQEPKHEPTPEVQGENARSTASS